MAKMVLLLAVLLAACNPLPHSTASPSPHGGLIRASGVRCADLAAAAAVSPHRVIDGVYACADAHARVELADQMKDQNDNVIPIHSDADFRLYASAPPVLDTAAHLGLYAPANAELFVVSIAGDPDPTHQLCLVIFMEGPPPSGADNRLYEFIAYRQIEPCRVALQ